MDDLKYWIWLSKLNLNSEALRICLEKYSPKEIWNLKEDILECYFSKKKVLQILSETNRNNLEAYETYMKKYGITFL